MNGSATGWGLAFGWALRRAIRFAIATCIVALVLAAYFSDDASERFATTAYLAAAFAAVALAVEHFLPKEDSRARRAFSIPKFPTVLGCSIGLAVFVGAVAALVTQPGAEAYALAGGFGLVLVAVLARRGTFAPLGVVVNAALRPRSLQVASTHTAAAAMGALLLAPLLPADAAATAVSFGRRLLFLAALFFLWPIIARTPVGAIVRKSYVRVVDKLDRLARELIFERLASRAAGLAAAALIAASLLRGSFSEPFAVIAYLAGVACAVGVAMECRRLRA